MMTTQKLTQAQIALLQLVADGKVRNIGASMYYGSIDGRSQRLVERVRTLDGRGLINPHGVAMKNGKPKRPDEQFADYHVVTLTPAGQQALDSATENCRSGMAG